MKRKILLVDDDEGYLDAVSSLLKNEGYQVRTARNADEARKQLASARPDLIVLDVCMPGKDGFAFAEELSKNKKWAGVPVVLATVVAENPGQMMQAFRQDQGITAAEIVPKSELPSRLPELAASLLAAKSAGPSAEK